VAGPTREEIEEALLKANAIAKAGGEEAKQATLHAQALSKYLDEMPPTQQEQPDFLDRVGRGFGIAARELGPTAALAGAGAALGGPIGAGAGVLAGSVGLPLGDLAVRGYNYLTGSDAQLPSQAYNQFVTEQFGLPEAETTTERIATSMGRALVEAPVGALSAAKIASDAPGLGSVTREVYKALGEAPKAQTIAGTTAAGAAQTATELGADPLVAQAIGLGAGTATQLRPNLLPTTGGAVRAQNVKILEEAGIPLTPAQIGKGGPVGQVLESTLKYLPTSAARVAKAEDVQQRAFTKYVMNQAGIDSDLATPEVLREAKQNFSKKFDELEKQTFVRPDDKFLDDLAVVENTYMPTGILPEVRDIFNVRRDRLLDYVVRGSEVSGTNYNRIQSELSEEIAKASKETSPSSSFYKEALLGLQKSLEDLMERNALTSKKPDLAGDWKELKRQFMVFKRVEDTMGRAGDEKLNTGFIPPKTLASVERGRDTQRWAQSSTPFTTFTRAGSAILPNPIPNSGTAQRSFVQDFITGGKRGIAGLGAGALGQALGVPLLNTGASLLGPYAVSRSWYGAPVPPRTLGILGARSLLEAQQGLRD